MYKNAINITETVVLILHCSRTPYHTSHHESQYINDVESNQIPKLNIKRVDKVKNTDLTKFNLKEAGFNVAVLTTSHEACEADQWLVAIYNNNEQITFTLPPALSYEKADALMEKVKASGVVDLTLWDASPEHIWSYDCYQQTAEEAREQQLGEQKAEFISGYIIAGGNQFDAETEWNYKVSEQ
ncbi:hypothetical protein [Pseudoalteromonas sp. S554]|uniref:hypothetical protein n=1 Tax=Pseudoalteromonas sp. S554 TaxID=2066516 RepID=UPI00110CDEEB|nr:hypothetical protein [Pseudoalteromonas sp. S554]